MKKMKTVSTHSHFLKLLTHSLFLSLRHSLTLYLKTSLSENFIAIERWNPYHWISSPIISLPSVVDLHSPPLETLLSFSRLFQSLCCGDIQIPGHWEVKDRR
ncbi:hypothetical protein IHE45_10G017900 [Dioscorea alata]|uniref:Uncharacterized protein n=1 Tax=Dioscorea alata TaxID=55571 RepID=A0ACB7V9P5_DIOAL|nr:hypothetical protein IHE45_10G017900 [Dioscorea alata]